MLSLLALTTVEVSTSPLPVPSTMSMICVACGVGDTWWSDLNARKTAMNYLRFAISCLLQALTACMHASIIRSKRYRSCSCRCRMTLSPTPGTFEHAFTWVDSCIEDSHDHSSTITVLVVLRTPAGHCARTGGHFLACPAPATFRKARAPISSFGIAAANSLSLAWGKRS